MRIALTAGSALLAFGLLAFVEPAFAQADGERWLAECRERDRDSRSDVHCEIRELRVALPRDLLTIDGGRNGGISVMSSNRSDVLVRARVETRVRRGTDAVGLAKQIAVTAGDLIRADGPSPRNGVSWSVSYVVEVPAQTNLNLTTNNGPISIDGMRSRIELAVRNGPVAVRGGTGGDVRGRVRNGPVTVDLEGDRWEGAGLDLETVNGPISLRIPENYSATLETGTVHGPMSIGFPMTVTINGRITRRIATQLGSGGPSIRVVTTNGPASIHR